MFDFGVIVPSGDVVFANIVLVDNLFIAWSLAENISSYTKAWLHIYFQIFFLFFTTMLYKLLKREEQKVFY